MKPPLLLITYSFILFSCNASHKAIKFTSFDKEGHRGCRGLMPENTIPAMLHAVDLNVTTLELDTYITKDSQVVVSHDAWFNPETTTKPDGSYITATESKYILYNMDYDSIQKFDVGFKPYSQFPQQLKIHVTKPLLVSLIDSVEFYCKEKNKSVFYNIEIKSAPEEDNIYHPEPEKFADLLMAVLNKKQITQKVIIQSFDFRSLQFVHLQYPRMKTSVLINKDDKRSFSEVINDLGFTPDIYSPHYSLVTNGLIKNCHEKGIRVIPWTVDDLPAMKNLKNMGADGLISDYPNLYNDL